MVKLEFSTPYGDRYLIHDNGEIVKRHVVSGEPVGKPSDCWKMVGLSPTNGWAFGTLAVGLADLTPEWLAGHPLLYKNGNPRYTVIDMDHGHRRLWGNTKYHGVRAIRFINRTEVTR